ncbi:MAG: 6-bladed beta-propeller [Candidatus Krumholzibacteriota bacterium]|nr:6-bladed beta-propeller [Candidatus Krumholzibacteriota bacterium]
MSPHHHSESARLARLSVITVLVVLVLLAAGLATGVKAAWQGHIVKADGVTRVENPAEPMKPPRTVHLEELWRIGGDSDDENEFFGVLVQLLVDGAGNVYLLDQMLNEVKVFSPDGEYLRTLGREGEGPGEFRTPADMVFLPGDRLAVLQRMPGRIVLLTLAGEPAGEHPLPVREGGGPIGIMNGRGAGRHIHIVYGFDRFDGSLYDHTRGIGRLADDGSIAVVYAENQRGFDFAQPVIEEKIWDGFESRWDVGPDGHVIVGETRDDYAVTVWSPAGGKLHVATRAYEARKRSGGEQEEMEAIYEPFIRAVPNAVPEIEDHDAPIAAVYARAAGAFLVLDSRGFRENPEGSLGCFDVFDAAGRYVQRVTLMGQGRPLRDGYVFRGNRLYVMTDFLDAAMNAAGGARDEATSEEAEPMSVICYRLDGSF